ncbi:hypothetical protein DUT91_20125 [Phyllobacterium salinisoli]|uniref:Uncharacterized protein n=1 Tax=Phyllobacterium salinisoli TaxID=1899321 RepID=A0A368JWH8_9HYPH|nr:hypothetical protein [Phyllobacterium salinisoli]RCS21528.1 hypothetical protein DUT91_23440 [Phyllobacterium salinisoli]RCS22039.1 hypothetical protein DUT91_20125 [Phyllobacterium salinisoli]
MTSRSKNPTNRKSMSTVSNAQTRNWTDEEVAEAVEYLKRRRPEVWAELELLEMTAGDLCGSEAGGLEFATLTVLHSECKSYEIAQLESKVRDVRRAQLGLK